MLYNRNEKDGKDEVVEKDLSNQNSAAGSTPAYLLFSHVEDLLKNIFQLLSILSNVNKLIMYFNLPSYL